MSWKLKFGLISFGLLFGLLITEIALRFIPLDRGRSSFESVEDLRHAILTESPKVEGKEGVSLQSLIDPHPDDRLIYELRPNLSVRFQRAQVHTNSCGMRDKERTIQRPSNTFRIAMLGDSFAFGWGVEDDETTSAILERELNRLGKGGLKFEVLNFGVPGYSTFQEEAQFYHRVADFEPDLVLVFFIENDFGLPFFIRNIVQGDGLLTATAFSKLTQRALQPKKEEVNVLLAGLDANRALMRLSDFLRDKGTKLFLFPNPKDQWVKDRGKLWVLKQRPEIQVVDIRNGFMERFRNLGAKPEELSLTFDPHPSPLKHQIMGEVLATYLWAALM